MTLPLSYQEILDLQAANQSLQQQVEALLGFRHADDITGE